MDRVFHGFGGKLHHEVPSWARDDALIHIRIRCDARQSPRLTDPNLAKALLNSVAFYEERGRWWANVFLLMPDHLHALLAFAPGENMSNVIRSWKRYHAVTNEVAWQSGYFDHRLRDHDIQWHQKREYILNNPVASGLCKAPNEWPWRYESRVVSVETRADQRTR